MTKEPSEIIVAMDNSRHALSAANWGARIGHKTGAHVTLVHILEHRYLSTAFFAELSSALGAAPPDHTYENYQNFMEERGRNILSAGKTVCEAQGLQPTLSLVDGVIHEKLKSLAARADLLIVGRRGDHSQFGGHLLGGEGERAIRHADCSCLIVPEAFEPPRKLVIGVNSGEPAHSAASWAAVLSRVFPEILVDPVHAVPRGTTEDCTIQEVGTTVTQLVEGDPEAVLIDRCRLDPLATICAIGATGHTRTLRELLLGTISVHLIHKLRGPVLLAR